MSMSSTFDPRRMERIAIFIDGTNLYERLVEYLKIKKIKKGEYEFYLVNLINNLRGCRKLIRTYFYTNPGKKVEMEDFLLGIHNENHANYIDVKLGRHNKSTKQEKRVDTLLVVDLLSLSYNNAIDTAIIVSGDEDFIDAVRTVKSIGKHVEIASFEKGGNQEFINEADVFKKIDDMLIGEDNTILKKRHNKNK